MSPKDFQDMMRLSDAARRTLLNQLKAQAEASGNRTAGGKENRRKDRRWDYTQSDVAVTVEHPGGTLSRYLVTARNLSSGGIAFLHGGFLHKNTRCRIQLRRLGGTAEDAVVGAVTNCRHVEGRVHEVSIKFERRIDPMQYVNPKAEGPSGKAKASIELPDLRGAVLYIEDSDADNRLLQHHLRASGIQLQTATDADAAAQALARQPFDIILCDLNLGAARGEDVIAALRAKGFQGPVVAVSADNGEERIASARAAGASEFLAKPYQPADLYALMTRLHQSVGAVLDRAATLSSKREQAGAGSVIDGYVQRAHVAGLQLKDLIAAGDLASVRTVCQDISGAAPGHGFEALGAAASDAIKILDGAGQINAAAKELRALRLLCEHVTSGRKDDAGPGVDAK